MKGEIGYRRSQTLLHFACLLHFALLTSNFALPPALPVRQTSHFKLLTSNFFKAFRQRRKDKPETGNWQSRVRNALQVSSFKSQPLEIPLDACLHSKLQPEHLYLPQEQF